MPMPLVIDRTRRTTAAPRLVCLALALIGVVVAWRAAQTPRQHLLALVAAIFFLRFALMLLLLVPRPMPWWEAGVTGGGMAVLPVILGVIARVDSLAPSDAASLLVHLLGSVLTSGSELQRWHFKRTRQGRLYIGGQFFSHAKHINYTGEIITFVGWCALTRRLVALLVPAFFALALRHVYAPDLDRYVRRRYGNDPDIDLWKALPGFVPHTSSAAIAGGLTASVVLWVCVSDVHMGSA